MCMNMQNIQSTILCLRNKADLYLNSIFFTHIYENSIFYKNSLFDLLISY